MNKIKRWFRKVDERFGYNYPVLYILFKTAIALFALWLTVSIVKYILLLIVFLSITPPWED